MIHKTDSPELIKEKMMLLGMFIATLVASFKLGFGDYSPLAGVFTTSVLAAFLINRVRKALQAEELQS